MMRLIYLKFTFYVIINLFFSNNLVGKSSVWDDCDKYIRQGDSLFKAADYLTALKKYKSCIAVHDGKDDYSKSRILAIDEIFNLKANAITLTKLNKSLEAIERYKKILTINPFDSEIKNTLGVLLESESERLIQEGDNDAAYETIIDAIKYANNELKAPFEAKLSQIDERRKNPEYLKIQDDAKSMLVVGKFVEAIKKYKTVFLMAGYTKDINTKNQIKNIEALITLRTDAQKKITEGKFEEAINDLETIIKKNINDPITKDNLVSSYEKFADNLAKEGKKEDAIALLTKGIEVFKEDNKKANTLKKKLKNISNKK